MRTLLQRVSQASVSIDGNTVGNIGPGLVVFIGVETGDSAADAKYLSEKTAGLRIFSDADSKFNLSVLDTNGQVLVISQFTLLADTKRGRRPSFIEASPPDQAEALIDKFVEYLRSSGLKVETGQFRAHMLVEIHNDGPVTIPLNSRREGFSK